MPKIVKITAAKPVRFSVDGRNVQEFDPGNLYEVPDHVADGMVRRNWGKVMTAEELKAADDASGGTPPAEPTPEPAPAPAPEVEVVVENNDTEGDAPEGESESGGEEEGGEDAEDPDLSGPQATLTTPVAKRGPGRPKKSS